MIDYQILADSQKFYTKAGYISIETPWTVTRAISDLTRPPCAKDFKLENRDKVLVASAEQGFLYLYNKGFLPKGKFQSISPCFRDEPFDIYHTKYFIKNELINTIEVTEDSLKWMIEDARLFFQQYFPKKYPVAIKTPQGYDLEVDNVELGSYGIRENKFLKYVYGTGVALPRLSRVIGK